MKDQDVNITDAQSWLSHALQYHLHTLPPYSFKQLFKRHDDHAFLWWNYEGFCLFVCYSLVMDSSSAEIWHVILSSYEGPHYWLVKVDIAILI